MFRHSLVPLLTLLLAGCAPAPEPKKTESKPAASQSKYGISVQAGPMDSILLKDYQPETSLVTPAHPVEKARFPVIDAHSHSSMSRIKTRADVDDWVKTMDETGVERSVVFTNAIGAEFDRQAELFLGAYPKRFQVWASLDVSNFDEPDYGQRAAAEIERCFKNGARGIGEITDKGWGLEASEKGAPPRDKRLRIDSPRLDPVWKKCAELKLPVNIHIADHPSCWRPLGPKQERTPDFQHFNMTEKDVPSHAELLATRDRLLERQTQTTFIFCHFANQGHDLAALAKLLDRHPNFYVDLSARDYEIGRQPRTAKAFLDKYRTRVLYGTDMGREKKMYQSWWRLLETADEYLPGRIWWPYYGLELGDATLKAIYRENSLRVLNWQ